MIYIGYSLVTGTTQVVNADFAFLIHNWRKSTCDLILYAFIQSSFTHHHFSMSLPLWVRSKAIQTNLDRDDKEYEQKKENKEIDHLLESLSFLGS